VYNENYEKEKTLQVVDSVPLSFLNLSVDLSVESPYGITKVKNSHGFSTWASQCCGSGYVSGSGLDPYSMGSLEGKKDPTKTAKKFIRPWD
jgi:hypothetical protein